MLGLGGLPRFQDERVAIRQHIRQQMRRRGLLRFCDDEPSPPEPDSLEGGGPLWSEHPHTFSRPYKRSLIKAGVAATTTDHELQSMTNTITPDNEFWSSSGTQQADIDEGLLYQLESPSCCLHHVSVAVYRAHYQHGDPLYPPVSVSFWVGPSPNQLYPASPRYPCKRTDETQTFPLYCSSPVAGYLLVCLHGKLQQQWEDMQYYIAIRHVAAYGEALRPHELPEFIHGLRYRGPTWDCSWSAGSPATASASSHEAAATAEMQGASSRNDLPISGVQDAERQTQTAADSLAAGSMPQSSGSDTALSRGASAPSTISAVPSGTASSTAHSLHTGRAAASRSEHMPQGPVACVLLPSHGLQGAARRTALASGLAGLEPIPMTTEQSSGVSAALAGTSAMVSQAPTDAEAQPATDAMPDVQQGTAAADPASAAGAELGQIPVEMDQFHGLREVWETLRARVWRAGADSRIGPGTQPAPISAASTSSAPGSLAQHAGLQQTPSPASERRLPVASPIVPAGQQRPDQMCSSSSGRAQDSDRMQVGDDDRTQAVPESDMQDLPAPLTPHIQLCLPPSPSQALASSSQQEAHQTCEQAQGPCERSSHAADPRLPKRSRIELEPSSAAHGSKVHDRSPAGLPLQASTAVTEQQPQQQEQHVLLAQGKDQKEQGQQTVRNWLFGGYWLLGLQVPELFACIDVGRMQFGDVDSTLNSMIGHGEQDTWPVFEYDVDFDCITPGIAAQCE